MGKKLASDISAPAKHSECGSPDRPERPARERPARAAAASITDALELRGLELPSERPINARYRSVFGLGFDAQVLYITKQILNTIEAQPMPPHHTSERLSPPTSERLSPPRSERLSPPRSERLSPPREDTPERPWPPERHISERHQPPRQEAPEQIGPPDPERHSPPGAERRSPPVPILSERPESPDDSAFEDLLNLDSDPNDEYELIEASIDSGASVTIMPKGICGHLPIHPTRDSAAGVVYKAASGHPVPDWGSRTFSAQTDEFKRPRTAIEKKKGIYAMNLGQEGVSVSEPRTPGTAADPPTDPPLDSPATK